MPQEKTSNMDIKRINRNRIYRCIHQHDRISRQEIASLLHMSMPTVLQNTGELLEDGLIQEMGVFESTGGRKARALSGMPDHRLALGVDVTRNHVSLVLVNLAGQVLRQARISRPFSFTREEGTGLDALVEGFVRDWNIPQERILGVGFSIPGIISASGDHIIQTHVLEQSDIPYAAFGGRLPYPGLFMNDANAAGSAELFNSEPGRSAVYLSLSNTVGGAIFQGGRLQVGMNCRGGEFGHMCLVPGGKTCYCGKTGCADAYCSALVLAAQNDGKPEAFFENLKAGNPSAIAVWESYSTHLCQFINNLRMAFDCDVILGGYVGACLHEHLPELRDRVARLNTFERDGSYLQVCRYRFEASALGAALQHIEAFLQRV